MADENKKKSKGKSEGTGPSGGMSYADSSAMVGDNNNPDATKVYVDSQNRAQQDRHHKADLEAKAAAKANRSATDLAIAQMNQQGQNSRQGNQLKFDKEKMEKDLQDRANNRAAELMRNEADNDAQMWRERRQQDNDTQLEGMKQGSQQKMLQDTLGAKALEAARQQQADLEKQREAMEAQMEQQQASQAHATSERRSKQGRSASKRAPMMDGTRQQAAIDQHLINRAKQRLLNKF